MALTKKSLSPGRRRLLELMQKVNFGRVEHLCIRSGEPQWEPPPKVTEHIKIGGTNGPRGELDHADFELKAQLVEFFSHLDRLRDLNIEAVEVRHGLPAHVVIEVAP
jgi:hypothetical protein